MGTRGGKLAGKLVMVALTNLPSNSKHLTLTFIILKAPFPSFGEGRLPVGEELQG